MNGPTKNEDSSEESNQELGNPIIRNLYSGSGGAGVMRVILEMIKFED